MAAFYGVDGRMQLIIHETGLKIVELQATMAAIVSLLVAALRVADLIADFLRATRLAKLDGRLARLLRFFDSRLLAADRWRLKALALFAVLGASRTVKKTACVPAIAFALCRVILY
jgi:hypothetical protein